MANRQGCGRAAAVLEQAEARHGSGSRAGAEGGALIHRPQRRRLHGLGRADLLHQVDVVIRPGGQDVAGGAVGFGMIQKQQAAGVGVSVLQRSGPGVVRMAVRIGVVLETEQVGVEIIDVVRMDQLAAHQVGEGGIEICQGGPVPPPVEFLRGLEPSEGLGEHGTFHGMHDPVAHGQVMGRQILSRHRDEFAAGIAEVPGEAVGVGVKMAGGTGVGAVARKSGVVKVTAAGFDMSGRRVMAAGRNFRQDRRGGGVNDADGVR